MTALRRLALVVVILLLLAGAGVAWYLFAANGRPAEKLVPGDTLVFAVIPNGAAIKTGYDSSKLRQIVDAPQAQPLLDEMEKVIGDKNLALIKLFTPEMSGQSFLALTHFDPAHPGETGFVAGMHPKLGTDHFDEFVQQVKASYPDLTKEATTGHDTLLGVDYQWIGSAHAPGHICVARYKGWIVTTWSEAALQDFLERLQGKSSTPSLADNPDFQKSRDRVGPSQALVYGNYARAVDFFMQQFAAKDPAMADLMKKRLAGVGGLAIGSSFKDREIVDRFSLLEARQAQQAAGMATTPCAFDTLKFTGPDTQFYMAANLDWPQLWKNFQEQINAEPGQAGKFVLDEVNIAAQSLGIDIQKNVVDALGSEYSLQLEWPADATWPDVALYLKVDKPDDFKPVVAALVNETRKAFAATAVINEMEASGRHFATLKMITAMPVSPTITEDGPYFGFFLNETHAVRSFARDESRGLLHNDDFNRQIGSQRDGASQLVFVDTPKLVDHAYRTAMPWVSMAAMLNPKVAGVIQGQKLPADLAWLAPMGTWSAVSRSDDEGLTGYSISGSGNQGLVLAGALVATALDLEQAGLIPHPAAAIPGVPVVAPPLPATAAPAPAAPAPPPPVPASAPAAPAPPPVPSTNSAPDAAPAVPAPPTTPDATTPPGSTH